jgi:hypothetical protein
VVTLKLNETSCKLIVRAMIFPATLLTVLGKELGGSEIHEMTVCPSETVVSQAIGAASISLHSHIKCDLTY